MLVWTIFIGTTTGVDYKLVKYRHEGKVIGLTFWDTAGQERYVPGVYEDLYIHLCCHVCSPISYR